MDFHALAIVRGGGQGLDIFNNIELVQTLIHLSTPLISAVGHPEEKPFISRIADKDASTPSLLGSKPPIKSPLSGIFFRSIFA